MNTAYTEERKKYTLRALKKTEKYTLKGKL